MRIIRILTVFISIILLYVLFQGCCSGLGMAQKSYAPAEEAVEEPRVLEKVMEEPKELIEESPMVSEGETAGTAPVELSYVPVKPEDRIRVYSGFCRLRVESVEKTESRIFSIAGQSDGYVESSYSGKIIIRIPAEKFGDIFSAIIGLGEVIHKTIETYDVTEQFQDLTARLEIAEKTRERLYVLLEETDDVEERFRILKEIKRLTDEIESIRLNLEMIKNQISFSRITVELIARLAQGPAGKEKIPFLWIRNLDPLYGSLRHIKGRFAFELGDEFAVFEKESPFRAESAEGTRVRLGTTRNEPAGDSSFWQKALSYYLGKYYKETVDFEFGEVKGVIFTSKDAESFYYLAGVAIDNDTIYVVEIFFPDRVAFDKRRYEVKESLEGFSVK